VSSRRTVEDPIRREATTGRGRSGPRRRRGSPDGRRAGAPGAFRRRPIPAARRTRARSSCLRGPTGSLDACRGREGPRLRHRAAAVRRPARALREPRGWRGSRRRSCRRQRRSPLHQPHDHSRPDREERAHVCGLRPEQPLPVGDPLGEREPVGLVGPEQLRVGGHPAPVIERCRARCVVDARRPDLQRFLHGRIVAGWRITLERRAPWPGPPGPPATGPCPRHGTRGARGSGRTCRRSR
jgi:hypothetical protein